MQFLDNEPFCGSEGTTLFLAVAAPIKSGDPLGAMWANNNIDLEPVNDAIFEGLAPVEAKQDREFALLCDRFSLVHG